MVNDCSVPTSAILSAVKYFKAGKLKLNKFFDSKSKISSESRNCIGGSMQVGGVSLMTFAGKTIHENLCEFAFGRGGWWLQYSYNNFLSRLH